MLSDKEKRLMALLKSFPHPNHTGDDYRDGLICLCIAADTNGWTDEFIRICESNPDADFDTILKLLMTEDRFPPIEIVDDEEYEI